MHSSWRWSLLPSEIQYKIFGHLTFRERCQCSIVCRSWHSLIMNWPDMWKSLSTADGHNISDDLLQYKKYIDGSFVKHVNVRDAYANLQNMNLQAIIKFLTDQGCNMIEQVELQYREGLDYEELSEYTKPDFYDLTRICGDALTSITIDIYSNKTITTPEFFLKHCPKLERLCYAVPHLRQTSWISELKGVKHQHLVDFSVVIYGLYRFSQLKFILEAMPKLQRFGISECDTEGDTAQITSMLRYYCPDLVNFCITGVEDDTRMLEWCNSTWVVRESGQSGLEELAVYDTDNTMPFVFRNILSKLLLESHRSLKTLELGSSSMFEPQHSFQNLRPSDLHIPVFPTLTRLVLNMAGPGAHSWLCRLLEHSVPNLKSIAIRNFYGGADILRSLPLGIKHLEELELVSSPGFPEVELVEFFVRLAKRNQTLRRLALVNTRIITANVLEAVAKCHIVDNLVIHEHSDLEIKELGHLFINDKPERKIECVDLSLACIPPGDLYFSPGVFAKEDPVKSMLVRLDSNARRWKLVLEPKYPRARLASQTYPYPWSLTHSEFRQQNAVM